MKKPWTPIKVPDGVVLDPQTGEKLVVPIDATRLLGCSHCAISALAIAGKIRRKGRFVFWKDVLREVPNRKRGRPSSRSKRRLRVLAQAAQSRLQRKTP